MRRQKKFSLKHKIIGSFFIIILLSSVSIGTYAYYKAKTSIETSVGNTALSIVQSVVKLIDTEKFNQLQTPEDMQSEYYQELQARLSDIKNTTGLQYLYTMRKTAEGAFIYVVDGTSMSDEGFSALGDEEEDISPTWAASFEGTPGYELNNSDVWGSSVSAYIPIKNRGGEIIGILAADFNADNMVKELNDFRLKIILIIFVVLAIGILLSWLLSNFLVRSLYELIRKAELVKEGDLTVQFAGSGNDEVGELTNSFKEMVKNMLVITNEIKNNSKNVTAEIENLYNSFSETAKATEDINQVITEIATGSLQQNNSVAEVSRSMDEVFEQIKKSVDYANLVTASSNQAMANISQAMEEFKYSIEKVITVNKIVEHTASVIKELEDKSKQISSFSQVISEITNQTNLLALNAAIEAARAGEHGQGFAVVADEVRELAEQSTAANKQIGEIVNNIQKEVSNAIEIIQDGVIQAKEGVTAATKVDAFLLELQQSSSEAYGRVEEIIKAVGLIEKVCKQALNKVYKLAEISKNFSAGSQQAAASTEEQSAIMQQINENISNIKQATYELNNVVNKFKADQQ